MFKIEGATIINEKWLITAGHCLCNGFNNILKPNHIQGILGLHKISEYQKGTAYNSPNQPFEVNFKNFIIYPDYKCTTPSNDIGNNNDLLIKTKCHKAYNI